MDGSSCVFVHGTHHGAWCFQELEKKLKNNTATQNIFLDLPGHSASSIKLSRYSLDDYVQSVIAVIQQCQKPVTLVGHSFGGVVVSQVAERVPELIDKLIYLCAFLLPNGYCPPDIVLESRKISSFVDHIVVDKDRDLMHIEKDIARKYFYNECPEHLIEYALSNVCDEPLSPTQQKIMITPERFGRKRKFYIKTTKDLAILPALQDYMLHKTPVEKIIEMDTGHSPFFSAVDELSDVLIRLMMY